MRSQSRLFVCLCLSLFGARVNSAVAADSVMLKPKADAAPAYCEFNSEAEQQMAGPDGKMMTIRTRSVYGVATKLSAAGTGYEVSATFDRLLGFMSFTDAIKSLYDTDDPDAEDASPDHRAAFGLLQGKEIKLTIDADGTSKSVEGGDPIRTSLLALGQQNYVATSLATDDLSDARLKSTFGEIPLLILPMRETKVGDTWKKTQNTEFSQIGLVTHEYQCTLDQVEKTDAGEMAVISFKGTLTKDPSEKPAEGKRLGKIDGTFSGTARFSVAQGCVVDLKNEMKATIEIPPFWTPDPSAPLMKIDGTFNTTYLRGSTAERDKRKNEVAKRVAAAKAAREAEEAAAMAGPVDPVTPENAPVAWLQWGGPNRDFRSDATGLANQWPKDGPPKLWERPLGDGFSTVLCDGTTLYTSYSLRDKDDAFKGDEVVVALDAKTGKTIWEHKYPAPWPKDLQMEFGPGPHSTPLIIGDRLYAVGCTAQLMCLDKATGKPIWTHDLLGEFKAALNMRGYGSSPLAYQGNILLPVSAEKGFAIMAFSQQTGEVAWKGGDFEPGYASLFAIDAFGSPQLVAFTGKSLNGLDPTNGSTLWSVEHATQFGANISTPIWSPTDRMFFISSAYGMGARGVQLEQVDGKTAAKEVWSNPKVKVQHASTVRVGDWVYCSSGDFGPSFLISLNAKTGEIGWRQRGFSKANVLAADGKLIVLDEDGTLLLVKADPERFHLLAKAPNVAKKTAWTTPTLYGRTLFVRDRSKIVALDLGAKKAQ